MSAPDIDLSQIRPSLVAQDWHHVHCFGCGPNNSQGLHVEFNFHEETGEVRFDWVPSSTLVGAPGYAHGGVLASIMDESQGVLCFHLGHVVMTDELHVKYHKATPLSKAVHVRAWISAVRKRRMYTHGTIHATDGELLVSSRAVWYLLPERMTRRLFQNESEANSANIRAIAEANRKRGKAIRKRLRQQKKAEITST